MQSELERRVKTALAIRDELTSLQRDELLESPSKTEFPGAAMDRYLKIHRQLGMARDRELPEAVKRLRRGASQALRDVRYDVDGRCHAPCD